MKSKNYADIIDVANMAGVSPATVSRSFNHPSKVKPDTRKRIQRAVEQSGYIRNRAAQAIHGRKSGTVGLIVPTLDNAIFSSLIQAFSERLNQDGFTMLVTTHGYDLNEEYRLLRSLLEHRVEGIGLIGLDHRAETYAVMDLRETPAVAMWNFDPKSVIPCVGTDNYQAGRRIAELIVEQGHKKIALAFPDTSGNDRAEGRKRGVLDVLKDNAISVRSDWQVETKYSIRSTRSAFHGLFSINDRPTAVIAGNDVIAQGVLFEAQASGLTIPNDLSVAGIGDFTGSADLFPSLTTVRLRSNLIGTRAAETLINSIHAEGGGEIQRTEVASELMIRQSVRPLEQAVKNPVG
jgi:LacI family transcriptional regulator